jgi:formylglycine-generating enzyme required for sulfatase activity
MVKAGSFFIDGTEVTRGQYSDFLKAKGGDTSGQTRECTWNGSFVPGAASAETMTSNQPVTFVDFCDAAAFCAWADKRLCGKIGGGELTVSDTPDPTKGQWIAACGGPDGHLFPYGKEYRAGLCNVGDSAPPARLLDVGSATSCTGHYTHLLDMLGNAQEWIDACDGHNGKLDGCERIGGSYKGGEACSQSGLAERRLQAAEVGFRCCSQ